MTTRALPLEDKAINKTQQPGMLLSFWSFVIPFWRSEKKLLAWSLLIAVLSMNGLYSYMMLRLNIWSGHFYDAIQKTDSSAFYAALIDFTPIVLIVSIVYMLKDLLRRVLSYRWRIWLSQRAIQRWLHHNIFYRLFILGANTENPDQRIAEDINSFTDMLVDLFVNLFSQSVMLVVFGVLLWKLSPPLSFNVFATTINIPGYMLWLTLIFAGIVTIITFKLGSPLVKLDYKNEQIEANFRFHLMRIREYRSEVACLQSQPAETKLLNNWLGELWGNFKHRMKYTMFVTFSLNIFSNMTVVLPFLAAAPAFFTGLISLGTMYRMSNAFMQVQQAMLFFAQQMLNLAAFKATFMRLEGMKQDIENAENNTNSQLKLNYHSHASLQLQQVCLQDAQQKILARFNFTVNAGEKIILTGKSGLGKTTLIHCLQGDWPYASGRISRPEQLTIMPQQPYFPIISLRDVLCYPNFNATYSDGLIQQTLAACNLDDLGQRLDEVNDWHAVLSVGEQQCLNLARICLAKPAWVILDEPTASMDKSLENSVYTYVLQQLADATILTISHSPELIALHDRAVTNEINIDS